MGFLPIEILNGLAEDGAHGGPNDFGGVDIDTAGGGDDEIYVGGFGGADDGAHVAGVLDAIENEDEGERLGWLNGLDGNDSEDALGRFGVAEGVHHMGGNGDALDIL